MPNFVFLILVLFGAAADALAGRLIPVEANPAPGWGLVITARDEHGPLAHANIWVESQDGKLLAAGATSNEGHFAVDLADPVLSKGVHVTAWAEGHGAVSALENTHHQISLELPVAPGDAFSILSGTLTGFADSDDDTLAKVGLVAKGLELSDLAQFDSSAFVSPLRDTIDVFGPRNLPSNVVLPDQTFPVFFIPVRVNKPLYRLPALTGSSHRYFGVTGTLDVQQALELGRRGRSWEVLNHIQFSRVGLSDPVPATGPIRLDLAADTPSVNSVRVLTGRDLSPNSDTKHLLAALWEPTPGVFVPTDVKLVEGTQGGEEFYLNVVNPPTARVLEIHLREGGDHFRGAWVTGAGQRAPDAGLSADLALTSVEGTWTIGGKAPAQVMVARVEDEFVTSVGGRRYEERWVLVGPRRLKFQIPPIAWQELRGRIGAFDHVSVDLLQLSHTSYAMGKEAEGALAVIEKVRKQIP